MLIPGKTCVGIIKELSLNLRQLPKQALAACTALSTFKSSRLITTTTTNKIKAAAADRAFQEQNATDPASQPQSASTCILEAELVKVRPKPV